MGFVWDLVLVFGFSCLVFFFFFFLKQKYGRAHSATGTNVHRMAASLPIGRSKIRHPALETPVPFVLRPAPDRFALRSALFACFGIDISLEFCLGWLRCV